MERNRTQYTLRKHTGQKGRKAWPLLIILFMLIFVPAGHGVRGQTSSSQAGVGNSASETAGVDALVRFLVKKGIMGREEAAAMMEKKGTPGFSGLAVLTELLKKKGVLNADEADEVGKEAAAAKAAPVVISRERNRADFEKMAQDATRDIKRAVSEQIKAEIKEEVKKEVKEEVLEATRKEIQTASASVPEWTKRIRFGGGIRLRYQADYFSGRNALLLNPSDPTQLLDTTENQQYFKVRARLGLTADVSDTTEVGMRLTTGNTTNPITTNQTMGTYYNKYSVVLDLAYLKTKPLPGLTLIGGRIPNPWFFTDLVWSRDLTFDGFAADYRQRVLSSLEGFVTAGAFPLWKGDYNQSDKWLYAGQIGAEIRPREGLFGKIGVAYYDYQNTQGVANNSIYPNQHDYTAPQFQQKGNTLFDISASPSSMKLALAPEFRELNITGIFDVGFWHPIHVVFLGDYVKNVGFDRNKVAALTGNPGITSETQGYQVGLSVGHPDISRFAQWRAYCYYRYLEANAVIDAFTDPDFHLGGTNAKGWILGGDFGISRNFWLSLKWTTSNEISGPPLGIDSLFVDVNSRF